MKKVFFTVGPSQIYPTIPKHIKTALEENLLSLSHRSERFIEINKTTQTNLRKLMQIPDTHHIFYTSCALEAMERVIQNTVKKHVLHFVNGSFSREFYQASVDFKKKPLRIDAPNGEGFDFSSVKIPKATEVVCFVHNETSTGVALQLSDIYQLKERYPDTLFAIDIVSSTPYTSPDFSKIDIAFFSVQKGFGMPAGLGVLIVNDKALEKALWMQKQAVAIGSYHNFLKLREFEEQYQTRETPNVLAIYLLGKVAGDMLAVGIDTIRDQTEAKADLIYRFFENHKEFTPNVAKTDRSNTTIVIDVNGKSEKLVKKLANQGCIIAKGYGKRKDLHIRIGNFPAHKLSDVRKLLTNF
jgi:phosphoserine aminotransferase